VFYLIGGHVVVVVVAVVAVMMVIRAGHSVHRNDRRVRTNAKYVTLLNIKANVNIWTVLEMNCKSDHFQNDFDFNGCVKVIPVGNGSTLRLVASAEKNMFQSGLLI